MHRLGDVLAIVNPAARNGMGARGISFLEDAIGRPDAPFRSLRIEVTAYQGHAADLAAESRGYDTVLALGGDGVVHEVVAGLMKIERRLRPAFALIPCGNGNDYARTLGMPFSFEDAYRCLRTAKPRAVDVGEVNGTVFVQTLSFGLDAAIALGTHERRARTGRTGTLLFVEEGVNQLLFHRDEYGFEYSIDGGDSNRASMTLFAVQIGPTYGGGFAICPKADPADGLLDYCVARAPMGLVRAASILLRSKSGGHVGYADALSFGRARTLSLSFDTAPPVQADGEAISGKRFDISILSHELDVFFATESSR